MKSLIILVLAALCSASPVGRKCTIEITNYVTHYGKCTLLHGNAKACISEQFLDPIACRDLAINDPCQIEESVATYLSGFCLNLANAQMCHSQAFGMLGHSQDCIDTVNLTRNNNRNNDGSNEIDN